MKPFQKGQSLGKFKDDISKRRLFIYSLPPSMKNSDLYHLFAQYGDVEDAYIIKNRVTGRSKGFGYVVYESVEDAEKMIKIKSLKFQRKKIWIKLHVKPNKAEKIEKAKNNQASKPIKRGSGSARSTKQSTITAQNLSLYQSFHSYP